MRFLIIPTVFLASAVAVPAADAPAIIKGSDQFEFVYRVKLPEIKGDARVWIPLAKTDAFQTVTEEELSIPMKWEKVQDRDYANDICVLYPLPADTGNTIELRCPHRELQRFPRLLHCAGAQYRHTGAFCDRRDNSRRQERGHD